MLELTVNKKLLDTYRDYKIDLIEGRAEEQITFTALEHIIQKGFKSLQDLYYEIVDNESIVVCVVTGNIERYNSKLSKFNKKLLDNYIKYMSDQNKIDESVDDYKITYYGE